MSHTPFDVLEEKLNKGIKKVKVGGIYFHYKNPNHYYVIESVGFIESSEEVAVVYRALYGKGIVWVRPLEEFLQKFTIVK
ncbi:MAG TPA: DUF1653 domain-containing protein [Patescibacteria group bacterium]|nr:DUF1653 domain-containing protein [Patescibacteria group bacterium]